MRLLKEFRAERNGDYLKLFMKGDYIDSIPLGVLVAICEVKNAKHPNQVPTQLQFIKNWAKNWGFYPNVQDPSFYAGPNGNQDA